MTDTPDDPYRRVSSIIESASPFSPDGPDPRQGNEDVYEEEFAPPDGFDPSDPVLIACEGEPQNDIGNSRRLRHRSGGDLVHVQNIGWYVWDKRRWCEDVDDAHVRPLAHETVEAIYLEPLIMQPTKKEAEAITEAQRAHERALEIPHDINALDDLPDLSKGERKRRTQVLRDELMRVRGVVARGAMARKALSARQTQRRRFANSSGNTGKIDGMLTEAAAYLSRPVNDFDAEDLALNCENGTLRFIAAEDMENPDEASTRYIWSTRLDPHRQKDLFAKLAPVLYVVGATCPIFDKFISQILPDESVRSYVQRFFGYGLTARTSEQVFCIFHGEGRNGKSTLVDIIATLMGDYATTVPIASLMNDNNRKGQEATPDLVRLPGARLVRSAEPKDGLALDESLIKDLTGGEPVNVRRLNKEFVEVYPKFKLVISANRKPVIRGNDDGIWRRVSLVPFDVQIPKEEVDKALKFKLEAELSGILNWCIAGLLDYLARGHLDPPELVRTATQEYRDESDMIGGFVRGALEITRRPEDTIEAGDLYNAFTAYCRKAALTPMGMSTFNRRMPKTAHQFGFEKGKASVSIYSGIRIKSDFAPSRTHED